MDGDPTALALREALWLALQLAWPPLLAMLGIGLLVSVLQAMTQIQEQTLAFLPKLAAMAVGLTLLAPRMTLAVQGYAGQLYERIVEIGATPR